MPNIILYCIAYAGGTANSYYQWRKWLDPRIELKPLELPGRGKRMAEERIVPFNDALEDL